MKSKYEIVKVNDAHITVDVSLLAKSDDMYFNATEMSKSFARRPNDWLVLKEAKEYIDALTVTRISGNEDLVKTKRGGKYQGTWFHNDLGLAFARWLSPMFAVKIDRWTRDRLHQEYEWKQRRLEAKTGFLPMTNAVLHAHDPVKHYHFSNEADMINRIVLGMSAKQFRKERGVERVRDAIGADQLSEMNRLQIINTGLIEVGMEYQECKKMLAECHGRGSLMFGRAA